MNRLNFNKLQWDLNKHYCEKDTIKVVYQCQEIPELHRIYTKYKSRILSTFIYKGNSYSNINSLLIALG